jgi:hypothetical protein
MKYLVTGNEERNTMNETGQLSIRKITTGTEPETASDQQPVDHYPGYSTTM